MGEQEGARDGVAHYEADDADVAEEKSYQCSGPVGDPLTPWLPPAFPSSATAITCALPAPIAARRAGRFVRLHPGDDVTLTGSSIYGHRASSSPSSRPSYREYPFAKGSLRPLILA